MSETLVNWLWLWSKVPSQHLLVMMALARKANATGEATVKLAELAKMCRCSEEDIRVSLRYCARTGELEIRQNFMERHGKTERVTNTYIFTCMKRPPDNGDSIEFGEIELPGIPPPPPPPPKQPQEKIMMSAEKLAEIAADPLYRGLDVNNQAWKFKRWCEAQKPAVETTVRRFKVWLSKV